MRSRKVKMQFKDGANKTKLIALDYPKDDLGGSELKLAMETMVGANVLVTKDGPIVAYIKAYEEVIEKNDFEIE